MLAAALGRHRGHGALDDLEQGLLHALAGHVPGERSRIGLARDLVDLVDVDDAPLGLVDVVIGRLQQADEDVLHVLAHVTGLGEGGGVGDGERHVEQPGQGLGNQRFAAAGGADEDDVGLLQLDLVTARDRRGGDALVVVVHRH